MQAIRNLVAESLAAEIKERDSAATKGDARQLRLQAAVSALERFKTAGTKEMPKAEAIKVMRDELAKTMKDGLALLDGAQAAAAGVRTELAQTTAELKANELAAKGNLAKVGEVLTSDEIAAALKLVHAQRASVLVEAAANRGAHNVNTIRDPVNAKLEQRKAAAAADKRVSYVAAMALVGQWTSSQPPAIKPGHSRVHAGSRGSLSQLCPR